MSETKKKRPWPVRAAKRLARMACDWLFPGDVLCLACSRALEPEDAGGLCPQCREELDMLAAQQEAAPSIEPAQGLTEVHAAFAYAGAAKRLVARLKFSCVRRAAKPLAEAMAMLPAGDIDLIVPVPTTNRRRRERGFNQSTLIAHHIADTWGMPTEEILVRTGEQQAQHTLPMAMRMENLHGCMRASRSVDGLRVLIVDDVYTSGATAQEAARALYAAGARSVCMLAAARAGDGGDEPEFLRR